MTLAQIAELFQRERSVISKHISNVFSEGELEEKSNVQILHIASSDKPVKLYNLDVIISVGYRVKSLRGVHFRRWATARLKEYMLKGFTMDDERLKSLGGGNYWLIYERADAEQPFMGLTSFAGDFPMMKDIGVAKNYLSSDELKVLNNLVSGYFDFAEIQAMRHNPMHMSDYVEHLAESS